MKIKYIKVLCWAILALMFTANSLQAQPYFDRDGISNAQRRSYLIDQYGLNSKQLILYDALLVNKTKKSLALFDQVQPRDVRIAGHVRLCNKFRDDVQRILTPDQFAKWAADNSRGDQARRYRENLHLTDQSLSQLLSIIGNCKQSLAKIAKQVIAEKEKKSMQNAALKERNQALTALLGQNAAKELIDYVDWEDKASFVRSYFPQFSYNLSYVLGRHYLDFTNTVRAVEASGENAKQQSEKKHVAHETLLAAMKKSLTLEQYAIWQQQHFGYHDEYVRKMCQMTPEQYTHYKKIMNRRAMDRLKLVRSGVKGDAKRTKLETIDKAVFDQLSTSISLACAQMWMANKQ